MLDMIIIVIRKQTASYSFKRISQWKVHIEGAFNTCHTLCLHSKCAHLLTKHTTNFTPLLMECVEN